jgi:hypothetical protein
VFGVARHHAGDDVVRPGHRVCLQHLRHRLERRNRLFQAPLGQVEQHQRQDRVAHRRGLDLWPVARDHAASLELREPRLDRAARHLEPARDLEQSHARVRAQLLDQTGVERIDHID